MRLSTNLAPEKIISAATIVAAIVLITAVWLATQQPSLGIVWQAQENVVQIRQIRDDLPAALRPGQVVTAIGNTQDDLLELEPIDLIPEPDMTFTRYSDMDAFYARQSQRHSLLMQDTVQLATGDGMVSINPAATRPLLSLPFVFWFQLFCGITGLLAGASVWAYRRQDPATKYYALTGIGLMASACTAAVYSTRELAINGQLFKALSALNEFGALLFCGSLIAVLWYYPKQLTHLPAGPLVIGLYLAFALAIPLRLHNSVELLAHWPIMLGYLSTFALAVAQWRNTQGDPLQRAALRWFLFSWLFGSGAFLAFVYIPAMFGYDSGAIQGYAFGFFVLIYIGVAIGVLRYRLFRLDRWWFVAWAIFLGGLGVIALDLVFVYVLQMNTRVSLLAAMAIAGWVYFPLRQWLWGRVLRTGRKGNSTTLVRLVTQALSHPENEPVSAWRLLLQKVFEPSSIVTAEPGSDDVKRDEIKEGGLVLSVAQDAGVPPQRLLYCHGGARLFNQTDLNMLTDLRGLFAEMLRYRQRLDEAVTAERDRVARDLHDDVGARLLTLSHSSAGESAQQARQALAELRAVVYSMRAPPVEIADLLGDWRAEAAERCDAAGVPLSWNVYGEAPTLSLAGGPALGLSRVMRETISNALHHGKRQTITFNLDFTGSRLFACVSNPYGGGDPSDWRESLGLHNLRDRIKRLGGDIDWSVQASELQCRWTVDLATAVRQI